MMAGGDLDQAEVVRCRRRGACLPFGAPAPPAAPVICVGSLRPGPCAPNPLRRRSQVSINCMDIGGAAQVFLDQRKGRGLEDRKARRRERRQVRAGREHSVSGGGSSSARWPQAAAAGLLPALLLRARAGAARGAACCWVDGLMKRERHAHRAAAAEGGAGGAAGAAAAAGGGGGAAQAQGDGHLQEQGARARRLPSIRPPPAACTRACARAWRCRAEQAAHTPAAPAALSAPAPARRWSRWSGCSTRACGRATASTSRPWPRWRARQVRGPRCARWLPEHGRPAPARSGRQGRPHAPALNARLACPPNSCDEPCWPQAPTSGSCGTVPAPPSSPPL
jgi:hypothetical protein